MVLLFLTGLGLVLVLAYANGANDVSKAVATLPGSEVTTYRTAMLWGTIWTMLGAVIAAFWATAMLQTFTAGILRSQAPLPFSLGISAISAAILWVLFASRRGFPVSTTHAIAGGVCGAGLILLGPLGIDWMILLKKAALPLALSPLAAFLLAWLLVHLLERTVGRWSGYCLCVQARATAMVSISPCGDTRLLYHTTGSEVVIDTSAACAESRLAGVAIGMDSLHWLSSGAASFARGLNDAPKIIALMLLAQTTSGRLSSQWLPAVFGLTALAMGAGSYWGGRRVTEVLAEKVTHLNHTEGLAANLTTSALVSATAIAGMPVSTTHVSGSAIVAVGVRKGLQAVRWATVKEMALAWVVTVPAAATLAGLLAVLCRFL